ncbi:MAG: AAA family ATPase [Candidatus Brocadiae bacterium]|nr:AAA family ATPase [Candidatus Brocadiia bacterium]
MLKAPPKQNKTDKEPSLREFLIEPENQLAYNIASGLIEGKEVQYNPLVFYGPENSGKTHLLHSVHKEIQKKYPDSEVMYLTAKKFHENFSRACHHKEYSIFRNTYRECQYLFIEDMEYLTNKIKTQQELIFTMNALQAKSCQIIFSSSLPLRLLSLEAGLLSRISNGLLLPMQPLSKKTVLEYCRKTASVYGVNGDSEAFESLWEHCGKSFGNFQKTFLHIVIIMSQKKQSISLPLVQSSIKMYMEQRNPCTIEKLLECIAEYYQVPLETLKEKNGKQSSANAKSVAIFLAKDLLGMDVKQIQEIFGKRSESSIRYIFQKIASEPSLQSDQQKIRQRMDLLKQEPNTNFKELTA